MFGLLNLNKPAGLTSRDAVNRVQRLVRPTKVGHAGTLDPIATGVLVLCLGQATKLIEHVQRMPKRYRGTFLLGRQSPSDDIELEPELLVDPPLPELAEIEAALPQFMGTIQQRPPVYSAIKVAGKKSYDLARAGKPPELSARPVTIYELSIIRYEYPTLVLDIRCGSGTYIRSLGRDLALALGTGAVMSELARTEIGPFKIEDGLDPESLSHDQLLAELQPARLAVAGLPQVLVNALQVEEIHHGRMIDLPQAPTVDQEEFTQLAACDQEGKLVALLQPRDGGRFQPVRVFV